MVIVFIVFIILARFPPTIENGGTSLVATELAAIMALSYFVTPDRIVSLSPIQTLFPIITGPLQYNFLLMGGIF